MLSTVNLKRTNDYGDGDSKKKRKTKWKQATLPFSSVIIQDQEQKKTDDFHTKVLTLFCDICKKDFTTKRSLILHMKKHLQIVRSKILGQRKSRKRQRNGTRILRNHEL